MVMPIVEALIPIAVAETEKLVEDKREEKKAALDAEIADAESIGAGGDKPVEEPAK